MNNTPDPWAEIASAQESDSIITRRVRPDSPHDFFWTVDYRRQCGFQFAAEGADDAVQLPKLSEVGARIIKTENSAVLDMTLLDSSMRDVFLAVCVDLMNTADNAGADGAAALNAVIVRIEKWQQLLKVPRGDVMLPQKQRGLWGELLVLRELFLPYVAAPVAAEAWSGPTGGEQDFSLAGLTLAEVKTQSAASDRAVRISSVDQLDNRSGVLFLVHQTVAPSADGVTLQGMVDAVRAEVRSDITAFGRIELNLREYGFADRKEYDEAPFALSHRKIYRVEGDFPRITRGQIPNGVSDVRYGVDIAVCEPFAVDESVVTERISGHAG